MKTKKEEVGGPMLLSTFGHYYVEFKFIRFEQIKSHQSVAWQPPKFMQNHNKTRIKRSGVVTGPGPRAGKVSLSDRNSNIKGYTVIY